MTLNSVMTRASKCGQCFACLRDNCGQCRFCQDKPRFGGSNILKQACILKQCPYKRYAPPAKVTPEQRELTLSLGGNPLIESAHDDDLFDSP